jgi:hypothetical protein
VVPQKKKREEEEEKKRRNACCVAGKALQYRYKESYAKYIKVYYLGPVPYKVKKKTSKSSVG